MSITLRVTHRTGYHYAGAATSSFNQARMTPVSNVDQSVLSTRMEVSPPAWTHAFVDYWGTWVTAFEVHRHHEELQVLSTSTVDVHRRQDVYRSASWETLRSPKVLDDFAEYLEEGPLVAAAPELADAVRALAESSAAPNEFVTYVRDLVGQRVSYLPGVTSVTTTAEEVWTKGAGVCQDLSHLLIGALRSAGVPARYVSGYLMAGDGAVGEPTTGESHAWLEFWAGDWVGLDPTNSGEVANHHIVVGHGRDYSDVAPLRGIFTGGPAVDMFVEVSVTRLR